MLPVVPAERAPSSFPNLPWISEGQAALQQAGVNPFPSSLAASALARANPAKHLGWGDAAGGRRALWCWHLCLHQVCSVTFGLPELTQAPDLGRVGKASPPAPIPPAPTKAESLSPQLPGEIPWQVSPRQDWASKRGGMRILSLCHCVLLCPCLGVYLVWLAPRHRERRMLGSLLGKQQDQGRRSPLGNLPGLSEGTNSPLRVPEFMQL